MPVIPGFNIGHTKAACLCLDFSWPGYWPGDTGKKKMNKPPRRPTDANIPPISNALTFSSALVCARPSMSFINPDLPGSDPASSIWSEPAVQEEDCLSLQHTRASPFARPAVFIWFSTSAILCVFAPRLCSLDGRAGNHAVRPFSS